MRSVAFGVAPTGSWGRDENSPAELGWGWWGRDPSTCAQDDRRLELVIRCATSVRVPAWSGLALRFDLQFVEFQEFLNDGFGRLLHFSRGAEEDGFAFVEEDDAISQFFG